jgi:hypothetical protein
MNVRSERVTRLPRASAVPTMRRGTRSAIAAISRAVAKNAAAHTVSRALLCAIQQGRTPLRQFASVLPGITLAGAHFWVVSEKCE